jgi:hypothetical protein
MTEKQTIFLTDDNWADYLPWEYIDKLTEETPPGPSGYGLDDKIVTRLLAWVGQQSGESAEHRFEMERHDAVATLHLAAGWDASLFDDADARITAALEKMLRPIVERLDKLEKAVAALQDRGN